MSKYDELKKVVTSLEDRITYLERKRNEQQNFNFATTSKFGAVTHHLGFELLLSEEGFKYYRAIPISQTSVPKKITPDIRPSDEGGLSQMRNE